MNINKMLGYILLIVGLTIIVLSLYQSYAIFTGKSSAPEIFKKQITSPIQNNNPADMQQQLQKALLNILSVESLNKLLNFTAWALLAWVLIFGGSKLASIGVGLLKS